MFQKPLDPRLLQAQLDFFHKLGYSTAQVQAIQLKFGTDTDKVLGELVQLGAGQEVKQGPVTTVSVLKPGGAPAPNLLLPVTHPESRENPEDGDVLRAVVIDGSNVAMSHGNKEVFSCLGIQLAVNFFLDRGHADVTVFVPSWRKEQPRPDVPITDQHILRDLEKKKVLVFTPSRRVAGRRVVCNDDCFIVKHAFESDGIVVSNDVYRDLQAEKPEWRRFIQERLLMFSFVNNKFMPPDDPLGRHGPTLENFLRKFPKTQRRQPCPYGQKCTYGTKCRFQHLQRAKPVVRVGADELQQHLQTSFPELSLVEDMAGRLTLGHDGASVKKNKHEPAVKSGLRSGKKPQIKREKTSQPVDHGSIQGSSQEQMDSGLGSMDSQLMAAAWSLSDQLYGSSYGNVRSEFCPPRSAPCSCCSHRPLHPTCITSVSSHSADLSGYGPPRHPSHHMYPLDRPAFSQPPDFQHSRLHPHQRPQYWSDPFPPGPPESCSLPGKHWEPRPSRKERVAVRKKLLAIYSAQLVDMAMDMCPDLLDPQRLVAEILMLQSQNQNLR
uniref:Zinc finger CCCH-type containing 12A n=1 Tax=Nothobranchius kadleci TaxID=1051664 RepID=A0A1A8BVK4_NOTKA